MKISTEVANRSHVEAALEYDLDLLWIGARTSANPFAMQEIADVLRESGRDIPVLVKILSIRILSYGSAHLNAFTTQASPASV